LKLTDARAYPHWRPVGKQALLFGHEVQFEA